MKHTFLALVGICPWLACLPMWSIADTTVTTASSTAPSSCHAERLRCEHLVEPLGIDTLQPRLSWIIAGSSETPRGITQSSYRILVASTPGILAHDQGDLWDSGQVASSETTEISYSGKALDSRQTCFWKVCLTDSLGKTRGWSTPAQWEMGLLHPEDWSAGWITGPTPANPTQKNEPLPLLRTEFSVSNQPITKARLYVTALGLYEMELNGQRVGDHLFAPDWTDYSKRSRYQVYDVTRLVKSGANALGAILGDGWYSGHIGNGGFQAWGKIPALLAQLEVTHADGEVERIVTDSQWKTHPSFIVSADNMLGETDDARLEIAGWSEPVLDDSEWSAVTMPLVAPRPLDAQVAPPVTETQELAPKSMQEPVPGHYVFDFGQNMVGFARIKVAASAGTKITLRHAEMLKADGTLYTANLRGASSIDNYICKGDGIETWQPHFTFHGFRYVEMTGLPQPPNLDAIRGIVIGTDIPHTGDFSCSNPEINQLQSNIQWGMRGNYLSVPTDCPQRDERMGWMGDAEVFVRTASYNGDIDAFFTKWLVDVDDAQRPDGWFTTVAPMPPGGNRTYGDSGAPAWGDSGVICPWTIYLMYGDKRILQQHLPAMTRWVEWCRANSTGLIRDKNRGHDYGDWLSQGENTPKELIGTAYFAYSTSLVSQSYAAVGDQASAEKYAQLFEQIKQAFNQRYVQPDGHIQGDTQADYAIALRFGLLPEELRPKAAQYLEENVKAHHDHLTTGFVGVSYLLPALSSQAKIDTAYHLLLQRTFPSWLFSVVHGATTVWERWDGWTPEKGFQDPGMNSFNHYSLGSCGEWMFDTVAGIDVDPTHPGFSRFLIHPQPGPGLSQAKATFDSVHGKITVEWTHQDGALSLHAIVPVNTSAVVYLPTMDISSVEEGGQPLSAHPEIKSLTESGQDIKCLVGSGDYHFTCPLP